MKSGGGARAVSSKRRAGSYGGERPSFSVATPSPAVHLTLPGIRGWTAGVFRECPTTVRVGRLRSVLQGRTPRIPVLAPGKDLLQPVAPRRDPQRLGRRRPRSPGNPSAEVRPQRRDLQVILQSFPPFRHAPGAAAKAGHKVPQPGVGMVDWKQRIGAVASSRGRISAPAEAPPEQDATDQSVARLSGGVGVRSCTPSCAGVRPRLPR